MINIFGTTKKLMNDNILIATPFVSINKSKSYVLYVWVVLTDLGFTSSENAMEHIEVEFLAATRNDDDRKK